MPPDDRRPPGLPRRHKLRRDRRHDALSTVPHSGQTNRPSARGCSENRRLSPIESTCIVANGPNFDRPESVFAVKADREEHHRSAAAVVAGIGNVLAVG